jgi:hypothetical protein
MHMTYDNWKATDPRDRDDDSERRAHEDEMFEEELFREQQARFDAEDEATQVMSPSWLSLQAENEELRSRVANARAFVIAAIAGVETGHTLPLMAIDSVLTKALAQLGCAECGLRFELSDAQELACVRTQGVHAGHCSCKGRN